MKNTLKYAGKALGLFLKPIKANAAFFVFMYTLGLVCVYVVVPPKRGYHPYALGPQELFFDVYALCVFLTLLPMAVRRWVRRVFYAIAYIVAIVDVYCFVKFDSTLTPTMLLLLAETDSREAWEFLRSYITPDIIFSRLGWVLLVMVIHLACAICCRLQKRGIACEPLRKVLGIVSQWLKPLADGMRKYKTWIDALLGTAVLSLLIWSAIDTWHNKPAFARLMSYDNIGSVEHELTRKDRAFLYQPIYRLVFSVYANSLTAQQVDKLVEGIDDVKVDSCSFRSPNIVLIIGESFNRHHAQLYGYDKPTTPCQKRRADRESLPFTATWWLPGISQALSSSIFSQHIRLATRANGVIIRSSRSSSGRRAIMSLSSQTSSSRRQRRRYMTSAEASSSTIPNSVRLCSTRETPNCSITMRVLSTTMTG